MSFTNIITDLLGLKEENIIFSDKISHITKKGITYKVINGTLTYTPHCCEKCGCENKDYSIIKNGTKTSHIHLLDCNGQPVILRLKKQRFLCKSCGETFTAATVIVNKNCYISNAKKLKIMSDCMLKISEKDIARLCNVSASTVHRIIDNCFEEFKPKKNYLPKHLSFDEFKSTKDSEGSMSFICVNNDTAEIVDIVENRQLPALLRYFSGYSKEARNQVETICIDMYAPYISLIKRKFPNAKIIIDRFHIMQLVTRALNKTRVTAMNKLPKNSMKYKRLKRYWKLFLASYNDLNGTEFKHRVHFDSWKSQKGIVDDSICVDPILKNAYDGYQNLLYYMGKRDYEGFINTLTSLKNKEIGNYMKTAVRTLLTYQKYIENSMTYDFNNGMIEGINNYIKVIKRVAFGYRGFYHFRNRILISRNLIKKKQKHQTA